MKPQNLTRVLFLLNAIIHSTTNTIQSSIAATKFVGYINTALKNQKTEIQFHYIGKKRLSPVSLK